MIEGPTAGPATSPAVAAGACTLSPPADRGLYDGDSELRLTKLKHGKGYRGKITLAVT